MLEEVIWKSYYEFLRLLQAPAIAPEMWWIITPLIVITLLMTFYFGKYVQEKMTFDAALGNVVVLIFVGIDLLRHLYNSEPAGFANWFLNPILFIVILSIMSEGALLSYGAFEHVLPKYLMYIVASPVSVNLQAYVLLAVVYTKSNPTWYTLIAAIVLFATLFLGMRILQEVEHFFTKAHKD